MLAGGLVGRVDLVRIVAAAVQGPDVVVGPVRHQRLEFGSVEEMLAHVGPVLRLEGLVVAVDAFHHAAREDAGLVTRQQRIPLAAPHHLDHVPARAAELGLEFLDDLAVAAHRAIQPLQIAVDDEDQVVELLAPGHAQRAARLGFIHLAVAAEDPHLAAVVLAEAAVLQVFHEARLVDAHDRSQAHRHGGELPEVRHQPRMRIGGDTAAAHLLAEVVHLFRGQPPFEESARIEARCGMALEEHQIAAMPRRRRMPEMIEANLIQRGGRGEAGDMAADIGIARRAQHQRDRVPADIGADTVLQLVVAGAARLHLRRDGVEVGGVCAEWQVNAGTVRPLDQPLDQVMRPLRSLVRDEGVKRIQPFGGFLDVDVIIAGRGWVGVRHIHTPRMRQSGRTPRSRCARRGDKQPRLALRTRHDKTAYGEHGVSQAQTPLHRSGRIAIIHPHQERMDMHLLPYARLMKRIALVEIDDLLLVLRAHQEQAADHALAVIGHQRPAHHALDRRGGQVSAVRIVAAEPARQGIGMVQAVNDKVHIQSLI
ncbi:hypothetical protein D9M70_440690 [compost metagenome]